jgi:hypothetical protein
MIWKYPTLCPMIQPDHDHWVLICSPQIAWGQAINVRNGAAVVEGMYSIKPVNWVLYTNSGPCAEQIVQILFNRWLLVYQEWTKDIVCMQEMRWLGWNTCMVSNQSTQYDMKIPNLVYNDLAGLFLMYAYLLTMNRLRPSYKCKNRGGRGGGTCQY